METKLRDFFKFVSNQWNIMVKLHKTFLNKLLKLDNLVSS